MKPSFSQLIKEGKVSWLGMPERSIETLLSHVFFFGNTVIKTYKHQQAHYGDFSNFNFRKQFYNEDFNWNKEVAPDIYTGLKAVRQRDETFVECDIDEAEDFFIEMKYVNEDYNLTHALAIGKIASTEMKKLTVMMVEKMRALTETQSESLQHVFKRGFLALQREAVIDLRQWVALAEDRISQTEVAAIIDALSVAIEHSSYFSTTENLRWGLAIDNNCDNLLIINGEPSCIDSMPPKESWRIGDEYFIIVRTAVDAEVLGNEALAAAVYECYNAFSGLIPVEVTLIYQIRSALIQWMYRYKIGQNDAAEAYGHFARKKYAELAAFTIEN